MIEMPWYLSKASAGDITLDNTQGAEQIVGTQTGSVFRMQGKMEVALMCCKVKDMQVCIFDVHRGQKPSGFYVEFVDPNEDI